MELVMEIGRILLPLLIVVAIVIFVIERMKHKYKHGQLGKKTSKQAQLLDSLIPMGMIFGSGIGIVFGIFFPSSMLASGSLGGGIGMLFGYVGYEYYSRKGTDRT